MSIAFEPGLYVSIKQLSGMTPQPRPLDHGFCEAWAYRVLGVYTASETSEAYFILANDDNEIWFISNRHLRVAGVFDEVGKETRIFIG